MIADVPAGEMGSFLIRKDEARRRRVRSREQRGRRGTGSGNRRVGEGSHSMPSPVHVSSSAWKMRRRKGGRGERGAKVSVGAGGPGREAMHAFAPQVRWMGRGRMGRGGAGASTSESKRLVHATRSVLSGDLSHQSSRHTSVCGGGDGESGWAGGPQSVRSSQVDPEVDALVDASLWLGDCSEGECGGEGAGR